MPVSPLMDREHKGGEGRRCLTISLLVLLSALVQFVIPESARAQAAEGTRAYTNTAASINAIAATAGTTATNTAQATNSTSVTDATSATTKSNTSDTIAAPAFNSSNSQELNGFVSVNEQRINPAQLINHLVEVALKRDLETEAIDREDRFHKLKWARLVHRSKDMLEFMTAYQGFESSSEGADIILGEKLKLQSTAAVELKRRKRADAAHLQLTCAVLEIATGLGLADQQKREIAVQSGLEEITPLVGEDEAKQTAQALLQWSKNVSCNDSVFAQDPWDVLTIKKKHSQMLAGSLGNDDVVKSIEQRLHKYNHHSNFARAAAKFVNTGCSIVAWSPTFASPAAQAAQFIFVACTGGPEEKKLLQEIYLDRIFVSRFERLSEETQMILNNYNSAIMTRNPVLSNCAQKLMEEITSAELAEALTGGSGHINKNSTGQAAVSKQL